MQDNDNRPDAEGVGGDVAAFLLDQRRILELVAAEEPMVECLETICRTIPSKITGARGCILLANKSGTLFEIIIAPDLPEDFGTALQDAPINDSKIGTCGEAVFRGVRVVCSNISDSEGRWSIPWRSLCLANGIRACVSQPILGPAKEVVGSFMLCLPEARSPTDWETRAVDFGCYVAAIVIASHHSRKSLHEGEQRLGQVFESAMDYAILAMDPEGIVTLWSPGAEALFGWGATEAIGRHFSFIFTEEDRHEGRPEQEIDTALRTGAAEDERWKKRKDGSQFFASGIVRPVFNREGKHTGFTKICRDRTERKERQEAQLEKERLRDEMTKVLESRVEERTSELREALRDLTSEAAERRKLEVEREKLLQRLVTSREEERSRIAMVLNENLSQHMVALKMRMERLTKLPGKSGPGEDDNWSDLSDLSREVESFITAVQAQAWALRPPELDHLGLEVAIRNYASIWMSETSIAVDLKTDGWDDFRMSSDVEIALYRVVQESLANVARHARSRRVRIVLEHDPSIVVRIEDEGVGFSPDDVGEGLGLLEMRERISLLGGDLLVDSCPEKGTIVTARLPRAICERK